MDRCQARQGYSLIELIIVIVLILSMSTLVTVGVVRYLDSVSETQARTALDTAVNAQLSHERRFGEFTNSRATLEAMTEGLTVRTTAPAGVDGGSFSPNIVGVYSPESEAFQTAIVVAQAESGRCYYRTLATPRAAGSRQLSGHFDVFREPGSECSTPYVITRLNAGGTPPWPMDAPLPTGGDDAED